MERGEGGWREGREGREKEGGGREGREEGGWVERVKRSEWNKGPSSGDRVSNSPSGRQRRSCQSLQNPLLAKSVAQENKTNGKIINSCTVRIPHGECTLT